jgi:hypothetical protein
VDFDEQTCEQARFNRDARFRRPHPAALRHPATLK